MTSLTRVEELSRAGREAEARAELEHWDTGPIRDPQIHLRLADLCEELGLADRVIAELNYAIRDNPEETTTLRRLAQAHLDAGRTDRALRCYEIVLKKAPQEARSWLDAVDLLCDMERRQDALKLALEGQQRSPSKEIQARIRQLQSQPIQDSEELPLVGTNSPALLARFVSLFGGREGVFARQWAKDRHNTGYNPIREAFSHRVAQNHLQGNHTIGIYPVRLDGTVNFAAIDLDLQRSLVLRHGPEDPEWKQAMQRLHQHSMALLQMARQRGLNVYLEDSGGKGRHLWCFFGQPISAKVARRFCSLWAQMAGQPPQGVSLELYPKQIHVQPDQLGNLIKLPLGIHKGSGRRGEFLDDSGAPHEDQESFLMTIQRNSKEAIYEVLQQAPTRSHDWVEAAEQEEADQDGESSQAIAEVLRPLYRPQQDSEFQSMMLRCATLRALVDQAENQKTLSHDQAQVIQHTLGYLRQGVEAVNHVLRQCPDVGENYHLKSPLRGNPMSCARIRARIPATTSQLPCNCEFVQCTSYPTPILHLRAGLPEESESQFTEALARDYQHALALWQEAGQRLERIQKALAHQLEKLPERALVTEIGTLKVAGDLSQPGALHFE